MTVLLKLLTILLLLGHSNATHSGVFACQSGDDTVFQDRPCPLEKQAVKAEKPASALPLSIHESWFDVPEQAEERAFCDRRGCECGRIEKKHQGSIAQAVSDSLYMDGSWHRYEESYQEWLKTPTSSQESFEIREQMLEASCDVMMSQVLLRNFTADVMLVLKKRIRTAEERGYDLEQPCLNGIEEACDYFKSVQLFQRIKNDAASLRRARGESVLSLSDNP